jgi:glycosyltransferase involved in cell wall biosynthesis
MPARRSVQREMKKIKNRETRSCVIIPAYNEESIIGKVLKGVLNVCRHVIVVDDGSSDSTVKKVLDYPVTLLCHPLNLGQGAALQTGIDYALTLPMGSIRLKKYLLW